MQHKRSYPRIILIALAAVLIAISSCDDTPDNSRELPRFFIDDIALFWNAYDSNDDKATIDYENLYLEQGSVGLEDYDMQKDLKSGLRSTLSDTAYVAYYQAVKTNTLDISPAIDIAEQAFFDLKKIDSDTKFFDVYFLVGAMTAGGRISDNGLLIAVEMFSKNPDTPLDQLSEWHQSVLREKEYLPSIVVHEFVHMQQDFQSRNENFTTLVEQSISEGMADFVSHHLLTGQPFMNQHLHDYGDPIEEQLWQQFQPQLESNYRSTEWLYGGQVTSQGHPADMGYYVGYKILESYSENFSSEEEAIKSMLSECNYQKIYEESGYADKF